MDANEYLKHWDENKVWTHLDWPHHQRRFEACASYLQGESFIDVGCAYGHSTNLLKRKHPGKWAGLDFAERAIIKAKTLFPDIDFYFAKDYNILPVCGKFDSVVCSEVIEHVPNDDEFVNGLLDIAEHRIIITTPCGEVDDPGHLRIYTKGMLEDLFSGYWPKIVLDKPFWYVIVDQPVGVDKVAGKKLLFEVADIFEATGVKFFLTGGVCLGAHREKNFIDTDDDMDISVMIEDFTPKVTELVNKLKASNFQVTLVRDPLEQIRGLKLDKNGIHMDVPGWMLHGSNRWCPSTWEPWCHVHKASLFDPGKQIDFLGRKFWVPWPITEYLSHNFGESYMIPMIKCPRPSRVTNFLRDNQIPSKRS